MHILKRSKIVQVIHLQFSVLIEPYWFWCDDVHSILKLFSCVYSKYKTL